MNFDEGRIFATALVDDEDDDDVQVQQPQEVAEMEHRQERPKVSKLTI